MAKWFLLVLAISICPARAADEVPLFPAGLAEQPFWGGLFSLALRAAGEPPLWTDDPARPETYRFLYVRSFHPTIIVAIEIGEGGGLVGRRTELDLRKVSFFETGLFGWVYQMAHSEPFEIGPDEAQAFLGLARDPEIGGIPREEESFGLDGSEWLIEIWRDGRWQAIWRWSLARAETDRPDRVLVAALGTLMLELSGGLPDPFY